MSEQADAVETVAALEAPAVRDAPARVRQAYFAIALLIAHAATSHRLTITSIP